jgi:DNA-binding CsgD family transcriptional regulator
MHTFDWPEVLQGADVMRYTQQDFEGVLDFVEALYGHRGLNDFADRTMRSLAKIIDTERIIYGDFDIERQSAHLSLQPSIIQDHGAVDAALMRLQRRFGSHPLYQYYLQVRDGRPQRMTRVMTKSRFDEYSQNDEFVGQLGGKYQMGIFFPAGPTIVTTVVLTRSKRDFSERERALLSLIYPHLVQAFRNTASLTRLHRDVDDLFEKLEGPTSSVIVLSASGCVKRWTEQARRWIAQYCTTPFPVGQDRLPDCFAEWYRRQLASVAEKTLSPSPRDPLVVEKNNRQLLVQLIPDHFRDEHLLLLSEKCSASSWSSLAEYGLTPRELEVLAWVTKGKTNPEIAQILALSARTVQKHLEHVYQKLGVETRTTATVRALKMLGPP